MQPRAMRRAWRQDMRRRKETGHRRETETWTPTPVASTQRLHPEIGDRDMTMTEIPADPTPCGVRITLDGTATPYPGDMLRVAYAGGVVIVDPEVDGVEVEYQAEPRTWTDGDVVQHVNGAYTAQRQGGSWFTTAQGEGRFWGDDAYVSNHVEAGWLCVLRYQAGDA